MTEPTPPTDAALFKALKELVVEAQAVADDHHRPRYMRLDQALASARNAMLDYWAATPQPTQAQAGAVPLTDEQLAEMMRDTWGCASIAPRHAEAFARSVEAEVRKQDEALIRQMLEALEWRHLGASQAGLSRDPMRAITDTRARLKS